MTFGPYETELEALGEPMAREVSSAPYQPGSTVQLRHLEAACAAAGVELGAFDRRILAWLAGYEPSTVQVIIGLIGRAAEGK